MVDNAATLVNLVKVNQQVDGLKAFPRLQTNNRGCTEAATCECHQRSLIRRSCAAKAAASSGYIGHLRKRMSSVLGDGRTCKFT